MRKLLVGFAFLGVASLSGAAFADQGDVGPTSCPPSQRLVKIRICPPNIYNQVPCHYQSHCESALPRPIRTQPATLDPGPQGGSPHTKPAIGAVHTKPLVGASHLSHR